MIATTTASAEKSAAIGKRKIQILYRKNTENTIELKYNLPCLYYPAEYLQHLAGNFSTFLGLGMGIMQRSLLENCL